MFDLFGLIQRALDRMVSDSGNKNFDAKAILLSNEMESAILKWSDIYNNRPSWLDKENGVTTIGLGGDIASEFARLVTIEMESHISGGALADTLEPVYQKLLDKIRIYTEYGCAKGGCVFKPYFDGEGISIECIQADAFFPTSFDGSGNIIGAVFSERIRRGRKIYTRTEWHEMTDAGVRIINKAFCSANDGDLGHEIPLTQVEEWARIEPDITLNGVTVPLFGYFKVPMANKVDNRSPLGVSVFANAVDNIKYADEQYSRILREYQLTEPAIAINEMMAKRDDNGNPIMPKGYERLYRTFQINTGISEQEFYREWMPAIRDESLFNGLNRIFQLIEFNCGMAFGTISDPNVIDRTATEINQSKQRLFSTVKDMQKALQKALEDTVQAMAVYAGIYNLSSYSDYDISFNFDDSIVVDKQQEQAIRLQEVNSGILSPIEYIKWRYGVSDEEAQAMMPQQQSSPSDFINQFLNENMNNA